MPRIIYVDDCRSTESKLQLVANLAKSGLTVSWKRDPDYPRAIITVTGTKEQFEVFDTLNQHTLEVTHGPTDRSRQTHKASEPHQHEAVHR